MPDEHKPMRRSDDDLQAPLGDAEGDCSAVARKKRNPPPTLTVQRPPGAANRRSSVQR
jgi:hypothetical protein